MEQRSTYTPTQLIVIGIVLSVGALFFKYIAAENYPVIISDTETVSARGAAPLIQADTLACEWDSAPFLFVSDNVFSPLIYYSHVFPMIACAILALLIWRQHRGQLLNSLFIFLTSAFILWSAFDLILWADANPSLIMFFWSAQIYLDILIYFSAAYLLYVFIHGKDISQQWKSFAAVAFIPVIVLAPTAFNLVAFDYTNCDREAIEGLLWYYVYLIELLTVCGMILLTVRAIAAAPSTDRRIQIFSLGSGLILFLLAFSWGNIVGSLSEDWALAQYGLFGMPIFLGAVTYLIVQFQAFEVRVIATSALVVSLWVLLFSVLLLETIESARPIIGMTLLFFALMGILLVRSVRREIEQRELIEKQEQELQIINKQQEGLLAFISHEVKGYLAKGQAAFAGIIQGDYGAVTPELHSMADSGLVDMRKGVDMVADILEASNLRRGTVMYEKKPFNLKTVIEEIMHDLHPVAEKRGLALTFAAAEGEYSLIGDEAKVRRHVVRNLVDNAIHYTQTGSIAVSLSRGDKIHFSVKDTGVGITKEDMQNLFTEGGHGKESQKINVDSTGYGLFIAKQVVEAHRGKIWAQSKGTNQGSEFIVELPVA